MVGPGGMTAAAPGTVELKDWVKRDAQAWKCPCGGFAERADLTDDEKAEYDYCGRGTGCCTRAFVCCLCGTRLIARACAPEMD